MLTSYLVFSKPTEFTKMMGCNGNPYTYDNSEYICDYQTNETGESLIESVKRIASKKGLEVGTIKEYKVQQTGFYAGAKETTKDIYNWSNT